MQGFLCMPLDVLVADALDGLRSYNVDVDLKSVGITPEHVSNLAKRAEARKEIKKLFQEKCGLFPLTLASVHALGSRGCGRLCSVLFLLERLFAPAVLTRFGHTGSLPTRTSGSSPSFASKRRKDVH